MSDMLIIDFIDFFILVFFLLELEGNELAAGRPDNLIIFGKDISVSIVLLPVKLG